MKKKISLFLALIMILSIMLTGCKEKQDPEPGTSAPPPTAEEPEEPQEPKPSDSPDSPEESEEPSENGNSGGEDKEPTGKLEASAKNALDSVLKAIKEKQGDEEGQVLLFDTKVTEENSTSLGLTAEQFKEHVEEAHVSTAALSTSAHETAMFKCKDEKAAAAVKALVAENFDSGKWVCVMPEKCAVIEYDVYVLLAVGTGESVDGAIEIFKAMSEDKAGEPNEFHKKEESKETEAKEE